MLVLHAKSNVLLHAHFIMHGEKQGKSKNKQESWNLVDTFVTKLWLYNFHFASL